MSDGFALRVSLFYGAFFIYSGISLPFLPAWLGAKGLDAREIGMVLAAPFVVRLFVVPLSTRLADRFGILTHAVIGASFASVAGFALIGLSNGFIAIFVATVLAAIFSAPVLPLADAYALRGLAERRRSYGSVRLWGSVTFITANLGGGVVLEAIGARDLIWVLVAALGLTAATTLGLTRSAPEQPDPSGAQPPAVSLWRSPAFVIVVAGSSLIQSSHAVLHGFATLQWTAKGIEGPAIGMLWALGVLAEIGLFAVSGRVIAAVGAVEMIMLGALGGVIRWTVMAFDPPAAALPVLQCLHALTFGATHLGAMQFLSRVAPARGGATAQGDFSATQAIVFAAAMGLSGVLVESFGTLAYAAMALTAGVGGLMAFVALRLWRDPPG